MKKLLQRLSPKTYFKLAEIYHNTVWSKKREEKLQAKIKRRDQLLIKTVFAKNTTVRYGPFKGMQYIKTSSCSQLLPKILGSYEAPIHGWLREIIKQNYKIVIDIGSAEGYYAVGLALNLKKAQIYAFDTNEQALQYCHELALLNEVLPQLQLRNLCTHQVLTELIFQKKALKTLIICDIEGDEAKLLDIAKVPLLVQVDMLVEAHDFYVPGTTNKLIEMFQKTHKVEMIVDYPRQPTDYKLLKDCDYETVQQIINEQRLQPTKWLLFRSF